MISDDQPPLLRSAQKNLVTKLKTKANEYFFIVCQDIFYFIYKRLIMKVLEI